MNTQTKCMAITAAFEGAGFGTVDDAGDGAGWSFGPIQFNPKSGTLQPVILDFLASGHDAFVKACSVPVEAFGGAVKDLSGDLLAMCHMSNTDAIAWCKAREDAHGQPLAHWRRVFYNFGQNPVFRGVESAHAGWYWRAAMSYMGKFGFTSERAASLLLDICVQEGSVTPASLDRYNRALYAGETEKAKLMALAIAVGPQAGPWASDVEARKQTIAAGTGSVHGTRYDLAAAPWLLTDGPCT